jgi:hypothetical protein
MLRLLRETQAHTHSHTRTSTHTHTAGRDVWTVDVMAACGVSRLVSVVPRLTHGSLRFFTGPTVRSRRGSGGWAVSTTGVCRGSCGGATECRHSRAPSQTCRVTQRQPSQRHRTLGSECTTAPCGSSLQRLLRRRSVSARWPTWRYPHTAARLCRFFAPSPPRAGLWCPSHAHTAYVECCV